MAESKHSPLAIALQEYKYWRDIEFDKPQLNDIQMGAIGAAANIAGRLAGAKPEGIDYKMVSPDEITRLLMEIQLAPRMVLALNSMLGTGRRKDFLPGFSVKAVNTEGYYGISLAKELLAELKKAGAL